MSPTYWHVAKLFLESEFQNRGNEKMQILSQILRYSWQKPILNVKLFKYYTEKDRNKFGQNCHH